ncbi:MAG TPA: alpha/beta fold hydrolase [Rhodopila sp.]|uniref:alpha/beta fold hydrolase n=1 Tax=Rhodopila sp. TaxID=2480087 RepID=UPI002B894ED2|nr:alpha/beta fold hydrolase [Rhodopila sp.]HVY18038.1 alpha/beta fold hydrolase [Rhodopila sp.]
MPTKVYFATNRSSTGSSNLADAYNFTPLAPGQLTFGSAIVGDADLSQLQAGAIQQLGPTNTNTISHADELEILGSGNDILIFIHGFANSFSDGITRAAFNQQWLASSKRLNKGITTIAFTWPSAGVVVDDSDVFVGLLEAPLSLILSCFGQLHNPHCHAYEQDRQRAKECGPALHSFLDRMTPLLLRARTLGRRVTLLAHSMGNLVLSQGVDAMRTAALPGVTCFDEVILAASDANWARDNAGAAPPDWLLVLPDIATRISEYHSVRDDIVRLSADITDLQRMGRDGPVNKATDTFATPASRFVDCHRLVDNMPNKTVDSCHQYYRRLHEIRDDIASMMAGAPTTDKIVTL